MTDEEIREAICKRIIEGESLRQVCRSVDMPDKATVFRWLTRDEDFRVEYAIARQMQADAFADDIIDISDDGSNDFMDRLRGDGSTETVLNSEHVQRSKLRVDSRKWLASKMAPKKYGDATLIRHGDEEGNVIPMSSVDIAVRAASLLALGAARAEEAG